MKNVESLNQYNFKNPNDVIKFFNDFSLDEILVYLKDCDYRTYFINHYALVDIIKKLLVLNTNKTLNTILSDDFLKRYFKDNFSLFTGFINNLDYETLYKLLVLLDDIFLYSRASNNYYQFLTKVDNDVLNKVLCSNLSSNMIKFVCIYSNNTEVLKNFLTNNDRIVFTKDEITKEAFNSNLIINNKIDINIEALSHVKDDNNLLDELDLRKKMFKKYDSLLDGDLSNVKSSYLVSPDVLDDLATSDNRLLYLQKVTHKKVREIIIDELFHDNMYHIISNILELMQFVMNNKDYKIDKKHLKIYSDILRLDNISLNEQLKIYKKYVDSNLYEMLNNDLCDINNYVFKYFSYKLEKLDDRCYSNKLSRDNNCQVYDYRHDKYIMLVKGSDELYNDKGSCADNYQLINNEKNNIDVYKTIIYGYDNFNPSRVISSSNKDINGEWTDECDYSIPKDLMLSDNYYENITFLNRKDNNSYLCIKPSYIVCYDVLNDVSVKESQRLGIPIVLVKTNKLTKSSIKITNIKKYMKKDGKYKGISKVG